MTATQVNRSLGNLNKKINFLPCFLTLPDKCLQNDPPDFEDGLLYEIALHHQLDYFIVQYKRF